MANICETHNEINSFFTKIYEKLPEVSSVKKDTVYSIAGAEVSAMLDSYGGCHVNINRINKESASTVQKAIKELEEDLKKTKTCDSIWVNFTLPLSLNTIASVLPESFQAGMPGQSDLVEDKQQNKLRAWQWLNPNKICQIPPGSTHNIGGTAILYDDKVDIASQVDVVAQKVIRVLLVVPVRRPTNWNLPGGNYESKDMTSQNTALREAKEESGVDIDGSKIAESKHIGFMEFPNNQLASAINHIWSFAVPGLSKLPLNPPSDEIIKAEWLDYNEIKNSSGKLNGFTLGDEIKYPIVAAINGLGAEKIVDKGWMRVYVSKIPE